MKTLTIDFDLYKEELNKEYRKAYNSIANDFLKLLELSNSNEIADKKEAAILAVEMFEDDSRGLERITNLLNLKDYL